VVGANSIFRGLVFIKLTDPFVIYLFDIRGDNSIFPRSFCLQCGGCVQISYAMDIHLGYVTGHVSRVCDRRTFRKREGHTSRIGDGHICKSK